MVEIFVSLDVEGCSTGVRERGLQTGFVQLSDRAILWILKHEQKRMKFMKNMTFTQTL